MNVDTFTKKAIEFSQIKIVKFFFKIIEAILFWYYSKTFKKRKKKLMVSFLAIFNYFVDQNYLLFVEEKDIKFYMKHWTQIQK